MAIENTVIFQKAYDLIIWTMGHTAKFPKSAKLGEADIAIERAWVHGPSDR